MYHVLCFPVLSAVTVDTVTEVNQNLPVKSTHLRKLLPSGIEFQIGICLFDCFGESVS